MRTLIKKLNFILIFYFRLNKLYALTDLLLESTMIISEFSNTNTSLSYFPPSKKSVEILFDLFSFTISQKTFQKIKETQIITIFVIYLPGGAIFSEGNTHKHTLEFCFCFFFCELESNFFRSFLLKKKKKNSVK